MTGKVAGKAVRAGIRIRCVADAVMERGVFLNTEDAEKNEGPRREEHAPTGRRLKGAHDG